MTINEILDSCVNEGLITRREKNDIIRGISKWDINGYPILHRLCNEVKEENGDRCPYLRVAKELIENYDFDPNIPDKHQDTPLYYAAAEGKEHLVNMLVIAGADPNTSHKKNGQTPLEAAIEHSFEYPELVTFLARKTDITNTMRRRFQETLQGTIKEWEDDNHRYAKRIDVLLDQDLPHKPSVPERMHDCDWIERGCWIRKISNIHRELLNLRKREGQSSEELAGYRPMEEGELRNPRYTPYSSATFVKGRLPVALFGSSEDFGVIIRPLKRRIDYWYDGHREELTRDFTFERGKKLTNGQRKGQYWKITENAILDKLQQQFDNYRENLPRSEMDKYDVILNNDLNNFILPWNEGLLRYQKQDIVGILVYPDSKNSARNALRLRKALDSGLLLYAYNPLGGGGSSKRIRPADLMTKFHLDEDGNDLPNPNDFFNTRTAQRRGNTSSRPEAAMRYAPR